MLANPVSVALMAVTFVLSVSLGLGGYRYFELSQQFGTTSSELASTTAKYYSLAEEAAKLQSALKAEQEKNGTFASQISQISQTVGTLDKLAKTDKELLAKYSKVYFLNENYIPRTLADIPSQYRYPEGKTLQIHADVAPHLAALMEAAITEGIDIRITSAYRSFQAQKSLKSNYAVTYGKGANTFSADQGYSEHQLGTTIDFTTAASKGTLPGFDKTPAYTWLTEHAHEYGFILSYPKGNAYYIYEPWHWRYVGIPLATRLDKDNQHFYDLDQRDIDSYLANLFD